MPMTGHVPQQEAGNWSLRGISRDANRTALTSPGPARLPRGVGAGECFHCAVAGSAPSGWGPSISAFKLSVCRSPAPWPAPDSPSVEKLRGRYHCRKPNASGRCHVHCYTTRCITRIRKTLLVGIAVKTCSVVTNNNCQ